MATRTRTAPSPRPAVAAFAPYTPIEPVSVLCARLGLDPAQVAKLDANENPYGPVPAALTALADPALISQYPDPNATAVRRALERYTGVPAGQIVLGSGSDELIDLICRVMLRPGDRIVTFPPTFGMFRFYAELAEAEVVTFERGAGFGLPAVEPKDLDSAKVIFVASPNNPTGRLAPLDVIERLLASDALVVVDEAYHEFAGETSAALLDRHENLVVLRTFSKWAGLAGLRVGYALCPGWLAADLMKVKSPYNVNAAALAAAEATLAETERALVSVQAILDERPRLIQALEATGILEPMPTDANFVLCRVVGRDARALRGNLATRGVFVRHFDEPRLDDCLRISVGRREDTDRLIAALDVIRGGQA